MDSVVHFEIPAVDLKRAQKFYKDSFGWEIVPVPEMDYTVVRTAETDKNRMIKKPGAINGGMMKRTALFKSTAITIGVKNIDKSLKDIVKRGGKVAHKKEAVGDMGYVAYIKDTEGNLVGLFEPSMKRPDLKR